ncbi:D-alanyl-D-alanine carboxypeptidase/D-alanyl-D-alanine-endopeptidase [Rhodoferax antarcticus]|nr:D-alanyl-D-alanine carboxypeptidase/D-alanyl-D-alanine-endopeptidase [Rhodoferax antarcticus]APW47865.1 D-alanyl-D-alanine carboxypeptidase/D-alanyl-D-alanine-endopeptidase [Rhodoferax antarcticus]
MTTLLAPLRRPLLCRSWLAAMALTTLTALTALAQPLPEAISSALLRAQVPADSVSLILVDADGLSQPRLSHRAEVLANPASVMKLLTTTAALDLLGPAYTWRTPVWVDGKVQNGTLYGNLVIAGRGDPALTVEKLWLLLRRVQGLGIVRIHGDIVLDGSAFAQAPTQPGDFDGEPLRPYNATPEALLINFKAVTLTLVPDLANKVARIHIEPPLHGVRLPTQAPLATNLQAPCNDYRAALQADFSDPARILLKGRYPASCGEKSWPMAYADPASYTARALQGMWLALGGQLTGAVRLGHAPATPPTLQAISPTLAEVLRDINKFSNNVMTQQLFLTLAREAAPTEPASFEAARAVLQQWWARRIGTGAAPVLDNGAGLSRQERISAQGLARLLQLAYASPFMPELMASLPVVGLDGTLKRSRAPLASAHLKTGSLRDVLALAGYVHGNNGRQLVLVAVINHPNANAARPAMDAVVDWAGTEANRLAAALPTR